MDQDSIERALACLLKSREYHTDDPEEDDIVSGNENVGRIEIFHFIGFLRPAQCRERP